MFSVLTLCTSLCAADLPQGGPGQLEVVPIAHIADRPIAITPPPWGSMLAFVNADDRPDLLGANSSDPQFPIDACVEWLRSTAQTEIDDGRLRIDPAGDNLLVLGEPAAVARVRDRVREAGEALARGLHVEVAVWDATGRTAPPGRIDPKGFAQWCADQKPLWQGATDTRSGRPVAIDRQRWTRYVRDVEIEVAQKASIGRPATNAFAEGGRVVVAAHSLVGGDELVLFVQFAFAQKRGAVRQLSTGVPNLPDLEVPTLETTYGVFSGRIQNGGALAATLMGDPSSGGQIVVTVRVTGRTPPPAQASAGLGIFPCGALTSPALTHRVQPPSPYPLLGEEQAVQVEYEEDGHGYLPSDQLVELVRAALGDGADELNLQIGGGYLFVRGDESAMPKVEAVLRGLQDRLLAGVTVRHTGRFEGGEVLHDVVFPTLLGRSAVISRVLETTVLRDLFIEVAQEATMLDPTITTLQTGSWLRARVTDLGPARQLDSLAQCAHAMPPQVRNAVPSGGVLVPTDVGSTRAVYCGSVGAGQEVGHGDGPIVTIDGRARRTTLSTTLTW